MYDQCFCPIRIDFTSGSVFQADFSPVYMIVIGTRRETWPYIRDGLMYVNVRTLEAGSSVTVLLDIHLSRIPDVVKRQTLWKLAQGLLYIVADHLKPCRNRP